MTVTRKIIVCFLILFFLSAQPVLSGSVDTFLEPSQVIDITSPFRDRLVVLQVEEGDLVQPGQLLAELDTRLLQAQLERARTAASFHGSIDAARTLVRQRLNRLQKLQKLQKTGNAHPQELLAAKTQLELARAELLSTREEKQLRELEVATIIARIEEKKLTSPIRGVVVRIYKQQAELVGGPDQQPLLSLVQLDPLTATFHLDPETAGQLTKENVITLYTNGIPITGTVKFVSPIIDAQSGTVTVRINIPNPKHTIMSGSRCTLELDRQQENNHVPGQGSSTKAEH
jgi:RND family efflux transporter MFP subunit